MRPSEAHTTDRRWRVAEVAEVRTANAALILPLVCPLPQPTVLDDVGQRIWDVIRSAGTAGVGLSDLLDHVTGAFDSADEVQTEVVRGVEDFLEQLSARGLLLSDDEETINPAGLTHGR